MDMKFSNKQANILKWASESSEIISEFTNELTTFSYGKLIINLLEYKDYLVAWIGNNNFFKNLMKKTQLL